MGKNIKRQRVKKTLQPSEEIFHRLLELMPVAVYVCDTAGVIQSYNRRAVELWGRKPKVGDTAQRYCGSLRLYSPQGKVVPHQESKMAEVLRTGIGARDLEVVIERPDGSRITALVNIVPLRDAQGALVGAINCFQDITDRKRNEQELLTNERLLRLVLDTLPVGAAVMDISGNIIVSNPASQRIWGTLIRSGRQRYAKSKGWWHASGKRVKPKEWASLRALEKGETSINEVIDIEAFDGVRKIIQNSAVPIRDMKGRITGAIIVNEDISARKKAEMEVNASNSQLRTLTRRLMRAQDHERRRIARQLHETTVQSLIALKMNLARIARSGGIKDASLGQVLSESIALADGSLQELRTFSHLLHPPLIEEAGLLSALRWYVAGFGERSGIAVTLEGPEFKRLPEETEIAIFRVVQEALTNIHRHSGSSSAKVRVIPCNREIRLEVRDKGKGTLPSKSKGVGIAGMRERVQHLGGTFEISSNSKGTLLKVAIPIKDGD